MARARKSTGSKSRKASAPRRTRGSSNNHRPRAGGTARVGRKTARAAAPRALRIEIVQAPPPTGNPVMDALASQQRLHVPKKARF